MVRRFFSRALVAQAFRPAITAASVRYLALAMTVLCLLAAPALAQGRIATTAEALIATPVFFHGKQVVVRHTVTGSPEFARLDGTEKPVFVFWKEPQGTAKDAELRGEFWDLGRIQREDPRFTSTDFERVVQATPAGQWPARDQVFVILSATMVESPLPPGPTIRAIALAPDRYAEREVKVVGRFRGRNLYGDLPTPLNKSKWDFVLQSADAAVWVGTMRPRGEGFDLDPGARVDTGKWLEVIGVVRVQGPLAWIEASRIQLTSEPTEVPVEIVTPDRPREPPPQVIFSAPVPDEVDVGLATTVRIQFSRDMDARTIPDRIRVSYAPGPPGRTPPEPPRFTATYNEGSRAIEIRFAQPLERFQTVKIDFLAGITAFDGQALEPWSLSFSTGR
jgi:hypothetical protein